MMKTFSNSLFTFIILIQILYLVNGVVIRNPISIPNSQLETEPISLTTRQLAFNLGSGSGGIPSSIVSAATSGSINSFGEAGLGALRRSTLLVADALVSAFGGISTLIDILQNYAQTGSIQFNDLSSSSQLQTNRLLNLGSKAAASAFNTLSNEFASGTNGGNALSGAGLNPVLPPSSQVTVDTAGTQAQVDGSRQSTSAWPQGSVPLTIGTSNTPGFFGQSASVSSVQPQFGGRVGSERPVVSVTSASSANSGGAPVLNGNIGGVPSPSNSGNFGNVAGWGGPGGAIGSSNVPGWGGSGSVSNWGSPSSVSGLSNPNGLSGWGGTGSTFGWGGAGGSNGISGWGSSGSTSGWGRPGGSISWGGPGSGISWGSPGMNIGWGNPNTSGWGNAGSSGGAFGWRVPGAVNWWSGPISSSGAFGGMSSGWDNSGGFDMDLDGLDGSGLNMYGSSIPNNNLTTSTGTLSSIATIMQTFLNPLETFNNTLTDETAVSSIGSLSNADNTNSTTTNA